MSLLPPLPGGIMTQRFGPTTMPIQPAMYHMGTLKAWWTPFPNATFAQHCHAGTDFAGKPAGSPLVACEAGVVTRSEYDGVFGGGNVVEVEIRPGVRYAHNHCQSRLVRVGDRVKRGQTIATVGATGTILNHDGTKTRSTFGVHDHVVMTIVEQLSDGRIRPMIHDFGDFLPGGSRADAWQIQPIVLPDTAPPATEGHPMKLQVLDPPAKVSINAGVKIRTSPRLRSDNVVMTTDRPVDPLWLYHAEPGDTYTLGGVKGNIWYCYWQADRDTDTPWDGRRLYFAKPLCRIVKRG